MVTVIIATYNRPDVLQVAIRSALAQGPIVTEILVVGDACDERTAEAVSEIASHRVHYINLAERFGEQSGPNSIGLALARTEYVAWLNHDDVWLPDHLALALEALQREKADWYVGRAGFAHRLGEDGLPLFEATHPTGRRLGAVFLETPEGLEPVSTWVLKTTAARSVGNWTQAAQLLTTPMRDWVLRAWRSELRVVFGGVVSVLCLKTYWMKESSGPAYEGLSQEQAALENEMKVVGPEGMRATILLNTSDEGRLFHRINRDWLYLRGKCGYAESTVRLLLRFGRNVIHRFVSPLVFKIAGFDLVVMEAKLRGMSPGTLLDSLSKRRTGLPLPAPPDFQAALHVAEQELEIQRG